MEESKSEQHQHEHAMNVLTKLVDEVMDLRDRNEPGVETVQKVDGILDKTNSLTNSLRRVDEALLDARVLKVGSDILKKNAETFSTNLLTYNQDIFARNIISFLKEGSQENRLPWEKLGSSAKKCFNRSCPSLSYMYGSISYDESLFPTRKSRKPREQRIEAKKVVPEKVSVVSEDDDVLNVQNVRNVIVKEWLRNNKNPVCYFSLILDPDSFAITAENILHVSLLVKDGFVNMAEDNEGFPVVIPKMTAPGKENKSSDDKSSSERFHFFVSMCERDWREMVRNFGITKPMITRKKKSN